MSKPYVPYGTKRYRDREAAKPQLTVTLTKLTSLDKHNHFMKDSNVNKPLCKK